MNFKTKFWPNRSEKYDMGLWSVIALGIGSVVGAGIFALLGQVIMSAGYWTYGAFAVAGTAALFSGYSYGELAARYPDAGGLTDYFRRAFSCKCVSGTLSLIYMLTSAVSISMMAKSFGIYFTALLKGTDYSWMTVNEFAAVLIVGLALLNMMSAGDVGRAEILLVTLKILILGSLIGAAMWNADLTLSNVLPQPTLMSFWGA
ncbi:MAG: APC family permease, partial [Alphaproteobacteria bacterium]